ncbi:MAG: ribbon-helix-helix protein, CopG family [Thermodesulfobacteriota bacterium]
MIRTVISLDPEDKTWLDRKARDERVPMAELVRRAIQRYREECELRAPAMEQLLQETAGIWNVRAGSSSKESNTRYLACKGPERSTY